jgi:hypothetical protein
MIKNSVIALLIPLTMILVIANSAMLQSVSAVPTVSTNINVTNDSVTQNEPNIAVDPLDPNQLVVGYNDNHDAHYANGLGWSWSSDGGSTWTFGGHFTLLTGYTEMVNPIVAFDNAFNVYYCGVIYNYKVTSGPRVGLAMDGSIFLAKSDDGGHTFNVFQKIIATGSGFDPDLDRPWMCVNPVNNYVYVAWVRRMNAWMGPLGGEIMTIWVAHSTDGGETFSTPVQVGSDLYSTAYPWYPCSHGPQIAVGVGGNVYVSWHTVESGTHSPSGWTGGLWFSQIPKIWIAISTDYGDTFGPSNHVKSIDHAYPAMFISMRVDSNWGNNGDRIYIAYVDRPTDAGDLDIYVATATSVAGVVKGSWMINRVNDDPVGNGRAQFWPSLSVSPNGRAEVLWYDYRDSPWYVNVYYSSSEDGGMTWDANTKLTDVSPPGIFPASGYSGDFTGSIASLNDKALCVWMDNRLGNQEIFFATVSARARARWFKHPAFPLWLVRGIYPLYVQLPLGQNVSDINVSSIMLNETIPAELNSTAIGDYDNDGVPDLMVNFDRAALSEFILSEGIKYGNVTLTIDGKLNDGTPFENSEVIGVKMPGDVNMDGKVDGKDITLAAFSFGTVPSSLLWNPAADENQDGKIDGRDIVSVAKLFGTLYG